MRSELTPLLVFATVVAVATSILAVGSPSTTSDNLPIVVGHGTTIIEDNKVTTPVLVVENIDNKSATFRILGHLLGTGDNQILILPTGTVGQVLKRGTDTWIVENVDWTELTGKPSTFTPSDHGAAEHTNVERELFIPVIDDSDANATLTNLGRFLVVQLADAVVSHVRFSFKVPDDFVEFPYGSYIRLVWSTPSAGSYMIGWYHADYGAEEEIYSNHSYTCVSSVYISSSGANVINAAAIMGDTQLPDLAKGDYVGIHFQRDGDCVDDDLDNVVNVIGLLFAYVAEQ